MTPEEAETAQRKADELEKKISSEPSNRQNQSREITAEELEVIAKATAHFFNKLFKR